MKKIIIWGLGNRTKAALKQGLFKECDIVYIVDSTSKEEVHEDIPIINPKNLSQHIDDVDAVVINNQYFLEIIWECYRYFVPQEKIVITDYLPEEPYKSLFERLRQFAPDLYKRQKSRALRITKGNERDCKDDEMMIDSPLFDSFDYKNEYFRYRTFELCAKEIISSKLEGACAELGVFNGNFARLINAHFPDRRLYLFDTFEGFDADEARKELEKGYVYETFIQSHSKPSIDSFMKKMKTPDKCILRKGFFPDTITPEARDEKYVFVSLDVDFEESTYQGLKFFFKRLVPGGYIFLHDYNTFYLDGVKIAVNRFESDNDLTLKKIPIADRAGTLIITK